MSKNVKLRVIEGSRSNISIHRAIISPSIGAHLGVSEGEMIEICGKNRMGIRVAFSDVPDDVILIRSMHRYNLKVGLGELVEVKKGDFQTAARVEIATSEPGVILTNKRLMRELFSNYALSTGQIIETYMKDAGLSYDEVTRVFKGGQPTNIRIILLSAEPSNGPVVVGEETKIFFQKKKVVRMVPTSVVTYQDIGGLKKEIAKIREMVELPLKFPELFERFGIRPPRGVLLYGPSGTGKTLLAKAVANEANASFFLINGPEILSKYYGESEQRLRRIFDLATKNAPAIVFIDELDAISPKREESIDSADRRLVSQLLTLMDGLEDRGDVIVIGATNAPQIIDPALRRPGRFDRELEIGIPSLEGRKEILKIHTRGMPLAKDVDLDVLAARLHGYVGADIAALCREAAILAIRRYMEQGIINSDKALDVGVLNTLQVTRDDFEAALKEIEPSAMREVSFEHRIVHWSDIGGLDDIKKELIETLEWPLKYRDIFDKMGYSGTRGILLYGPPGVGKTMLVEALATETEANFIAVNGPELLSKWVGESEKAIRNIFRKARQAAPSIVCIDEIESITKSREAESYQWEISIINQLTAEMDGLHRTHDVVVIGITNRPDLVDPVLLRAGRLEKKIYVPPPDKKAREEILRIYISRVSSKEDNIDLSTIAERTEYYSGADLKRLADEAVLEAIRENLTNPILKQQHLLSALSKVPPSLNEHIVKVYESFKNFIARSLELDFHSYHA